MKLEKCQTQLGGKKEVANPVPDPVGSGPFWPVPDPVGEGPFWPDPDPNLCLQT